MTDSYLLRCASDKRATVRISNVRHQSTIVNKTLTSCYQLSCAASLYLDEVSTTTVPATCLFEDEMWGDEDIRKFYFCFDNVPILSECEEGYYFVKNATDSGCLPAKLMNPACVNLDVTVGPCTGNNLLQPQVSEVLTNFWLCREEGAAPVELTCPEDQVFIKQDGYLGCFDWQTYRSVRGCPAQ
ncbi:uncharacterized protein Dmoj_GI10606 [Drosophila mojavensis]|uniref:Chitin-binding type-2 domain-containing protein n=1 Tax=Drosophila mojavensis TaxID=7230 RepID=B4K8Y4_DROMO|nr:uncharacterized protein Dmoj_GI10606 [Drosophila mojavensis]